MTKLLADASLHWCGRAAQFLGWEPDTFWSSTPGELIASLTVTDPATAESITREQLAQLIESDNHG